MTPNHLPYWLAALYLPNIGPRTFIRWLEQFTDIEKLFHASCEEWLMKGVPTQHIHSLQNPNWKQIEKELAWGQVPNQHIICLEDKRYPNLLKEIADPPLVLYVRGDVHALSNVQLAMVGSRHATPIGLQNAEQFAYCLAEVGFVITSGLALGIDGASHRGALKAGGKTVGVLGTGLNTIYPRTHQKLADEIAHQQGAIISEFPLSTSAHPTNFPRRNRVIGGLSKGVIVVEAALKSGSLITARHALEQGREVFAVPGSIHQPLARGCHYLIKQGAKLVESAADILEELGSIWPGLAISQSKHQPKTRSTEVSPEYRQLIDQIGYEITPLDVIISRSGLTAGEVSSMLLTLELHGYVQVVAGGYVRSIVS